MFLFSRKLKSMRDKIRLSGKIIPPAVFPGAIPASRRFVAVHQRHIGAKLRYSYETLTLNNDKTQVLNGTCPPFFLEPERYKGAS
jgi:hypothetical protein